MLRRSLFFLTPSFMEIMMPALSPSMETGNLVKWNAAIGSKITQGTSICSIQTDKAVVSFDHQMDDGFLAKTFAKEGDVVEVGKLIAILAEDEADVSKADTFVPKPGTLPGSSTPVEKPSSTPTSNIPAVEVSVPSPVQSIYTNLSDKIAASGPAVSRIAREVGEEKLKQIKATGKNGRFTKGDVIEFVVVASEKKELPPQKLEQKPTQKGFVISVNPGKVFDFNVSDRNLLEKLIKKSFS